MFVALPIAQDLKIVLLFGVGLLKKNLDRTLVAPQSVPNMKGSVQFDSVATALSDYSV